MYPLLENFTTRIAIIKGRLFEPKTQSFNEKVHAESVVVFGENYLEQRGKQLAWHHSAWIGINRKGGSWVYSNSGTELEFQNWRSGKPKQ